MIDLSNVTMASLLSSMLLRVTEQVNKREGSLIRTALSAAAWAIEGLYIELAFIQQQAYGLSATGEYLDYQVAERGLFRHPATKEICIMRTNLIYIENGTQLADQSGYIWEVTEHLQSRTIGPDPENNYSLYRIECTTSGEIPNPVGSELRALSFIAGLASAKIISVYVYGVNVESDESLRARYLDGLTSVPFSGNISSYRERLLSSEFEIDDSILTIGALQVYPATDENGDMKGGYVRIWLVDGNLNPIRSSVLEVIQTAVCPMYNGEVLGNGTGNGFAPIGANVQVKSVTSTPILRIDISLTVYGTTVEDVRPEIETRIHAYIKKCMLEWGEQVATRDQVATIEIKESVILAECFVNGVTDVISVKLYKDGTFYNGSAFWNTNSHTMEWIIPDDVVINITSLIGS